MLRLLGPNEIAVFRPEAIRAMDGPGTKCTKAPWYDILQPRVSLATTRDKSLHDRRRKVWERALNTQGNIYVIHRYNMTSSDASF